MAEQRSFLDDPTTLIREMQNDYAQWVASRPAGKQFTASTLNSNGWRMNKIAVFFAGRGKHVVNATNTDLEAFLETFASDDDRRRHGKRYLNLIQSVQRHVAERDQVGITAPAATLAASTKWKRRLSRNSADERGNLNVLLPNERKHVMAYLTESGKQFSWRERRDRAIIAVLFGAGLKVGETLALTVSHARLDRISKTYSHIQTRGRKHLTPRLIPLPASASVALADWMPLALANDQDNPDAPLFPAVMIGRAVSNSKFTRPATANDSAAPATSAVRNFDDEGESLDDESEDDDEARYDIGIDGALDRTTFYAVFEEIASQRLKLDGLLPRDLRNSWIVEQLRSGKSDDDVLALAGLKDRNHLAIFKSFVAGSAPVKKQPVTREPGLLPTPEG
ncbi:MAG: hypothetical protein ACKO15_16505 [Burkholderiales bacterium]